MRLSLPTLLTLIFLTLKLCGVIHWSWVWVFAPAWIPAATALTFLGFAVTFSTVRDWLRNYGN